MTVISELKVRVGIDVDYLSKVIEAMERLKNEIQALNEANPIEDDDTDEV